MANKKKVLYRGDRFRSYLERKDLTYAKASSILSINKNTIGKAVRGGNLYVDVLLKISNSLDFPITSFFKYEDGTYLNDENYINSLYPALGDKDNSPILASEMEKKYKLCEKDNNFDAELLASRDQEIALLKSLNDNYRQQIAILKQKLKEKE